MDRMTAAVILIGTLFTCITVVLVAALYFDYKKTIADRPKVPKAPVYTYETTREEKIHDPQ